METMYRCRVTQHAYEGADSAPSWRAQHTVALWWPWYTRMASPVDIVHSLAVVSEEAAIEENKCFIWLTLVTGGCWEDGAR